MIAKREGVQALSVLAEIVSRGFDVDDVETFLRSVATALMVLK